MLGVASKCIISFFKLLPLFEIISRNTQYNKNKFSNFSCGYIYIGAPAVHYNCPYVLLIVHTLVALIAMSTRVFILKKISTQHALIEDHTLINFGEKNLAKIMEAAISNYYS